MRLPVARIFLLGALLGLAGPAHATSPGKTKRALKETEAALELFKAGDVSGAFTKVNHAVDLDPTLTSAHFFRAVLMLEAAKLLPASDAAELQRAARLDLTIIVQLDPNGDIGNRASSMLASMRGGDLFPMPETDCPEGARADLDLAEQAWGRGEYITAEAAYARATNACPANPVWWTWYGDAHFQQGEYPRASELYRKAIEISPCYWSAWRFLSDAQERAGDELGAWHSLSRAMVCNPGYQDAWDDMASFTSARGGALVRPTFVLTPPEDAGATADEDAKLEADAAAVYQATLLSSAGTTPLAKRRDAVHAALAKVGASRLSGTLARPGLQAWQTLSQADAAGFLDEAILVLLADADLVPELVAYQHDHVDRLTAFVEQRLAVVPDLAGR